MTCNCTYVDMFWVHHSIWIQYNIFPHFLLNIELRMLDKHWFVKKKKTIAKSREAIIVHVYLTLDTVQIELEIFDSAKRSKPFVLSLFSRAKHWQKNLLLFIIKFRMSIVYIYNPAHISPMRLSLCNYTNISRENTATYCNIPKWYCWYFDLFM